VIIMVMLMVMIVEVVYLSERVGEKG